MHTPSHWCIYSIYHLMGSTLTTRTSLLLLAGAALLVSSADAWTPGVGQESSTRGFAVNTQSRNDVISFWNSVYQKSEGYQQRMNWTGSTSPQEPGTISTAFKNDIERRINFYRAMAGMSADIEIVSDSRQDAAQATALMLSLNSEQFGLNGEVTRGIASPHSPPDHWLYVNDLTKEGAANSNLSIGKYGPDAIDAYMLEDDKTAGEAANSDVGHRRYILYSRLQDVATGDVPATQGGYLSANVLYVRGNLLAATDSPQFVSWPNAGFIPEAIVPQHWSLTYPEADFSSAEISMKDKDGNSISTTITSRRTGYGDNSIVWRPNAASISSAEHEDRTYQVTISNILLNGNPTSHSYTVTAINPKRLTEYPVLTTSTSSADSRPTFQFNQVDHAEEYELNVSTREETTWTAGAEDSASDYILDGTSDSYQLRTAFSSSSYSGQKFWDTGDKAFHLAFPHNYLPLPRESFTIMRSIVPKADASVSFRLCRGWMAAASRLDVQCSSDHGASWTTKASFPGNSNNQPDSFFVTKSVNLGSTGTQILVRFLLHQPNPEGVFVVTDYPDYPMGVFIDGIKFSNCDWLAELAQIKQPSSTNHITLDENSAGGVLEPGAGYTLRLRPRIGNDWMPYGPTLEAVPVTVSGPDPIDTDNDGTPDTEDPDDDNDGLSDEEEQSLGTKPLLADSDEDGVPDGVEHRVTGTNPLVNELAGIPGIDYSMGAVLGSYYGMVVDAEGLPLGQLQITLASDGSYSGKLKGINGFNWAFTGVMNDDGTAEKAGNNTHGQEAQLIFSLWKPAGEFRIGGRLAATESGQEDHYFILRRSIYSRSQPAPRRVRGRYTLHLPASTTEDDSIPAGDGIGWGKVNKKGLSKLMGFSNSGEPFSYSCPLLEGNQVPFFARPNATAGLEGMAGDLYFRNQDSSDVDGEVRYLRAADEGGYYAAGFDQDLSLRGCKYRRPGTGQLPLDGFALEPDNALASFSGGYFGGSSHVLSWSADGSMVAVDLEYDSTAQFNKKNGSFSGTFLYTGALPSPISTKLRGVVLQKTGLVTGLAITENGASGHYSITPNGP